MDQAAQLRQLFKERNASKYSNISLVSIISGKGGVGKTTLVKKLYDEINGSYIIDCDINSPFFWRHTSEFNCCDGFEELKNKTIVKPIEKFRKLEVYNTIIVDAGTGLNDINKYFLEKSKTVIFVTNLEEIAILNTINLMKFIDCCKVMFIVNADSNDVNNMQNKINRYARCYLKGDYIKVTNSIDELVNLLGNNRI
ncbi:hypothetical protein ACSW8S_19415 (plasmid) [Clostridium perfringens]